MSYIDEQKFKVRGDDLVKACAEVDSLRAALQSAKDEAERARVKLPIVDPEDYQRLLNAEQERDELLPKLAALSAECEALKSSAAEAIMVASSVFWVWGDKFAPGTVEDFRAKEKAFLAIAAKNAGKGA